MSKIKKIEKRRATRLRQKNNKLAKQKSVLEPEEELEDDLLEVSEETDEEPISWDELEDNAGDQVDQTIVTAQELLENIVEHDGLNSEEKGQAALEVGVELGNRIKSIVSQPSSTITKKEASIELLQLQALIATDQRQMSRLDKLGGWIQKKIKKTEEFPISSKSEVRYSLSKISDLLEKEMSNQDELLEKLPKIYEAAKKFGIEAGQNSIIVEKDVSGNYRAILWPTNNFIDRDGEIVSDEAHRKYVEWVNKNMDFAPLYMTWHVPGSARKSKMDFIGYEKGFVLMSCPLEEDEARAILTMQKEVDIGLSIGGLATQRDNQSPNVITEYFIVEVSDLPLERAANPFTDFSAIITKEADMKSQLEYLSGIVGEEKAKQLLEKAGLTQKALRQEGIAEKEVGNPEIPHPVPSPVLADSFDNLIDRISKEFGMEELSKTVADLKNNSEKIVLLESLVKELSKTSEEKVADMIASPMSLKFSWLEKRASQSEDTLLDPKKEEDKVLEKSIPVTGWFSEATKSNPVAIK